MFLEADRVSGAKVLTQEGTVDGMKKFLILVLLLTLTVPAFAASVINRDGYYKGIRLCGKVRVVSYNPDIKVKIVNSFPDLRVQVVDSFANEIGKWEFVEYGEDFTVEFVDNFPDIKIKYVESFPGVE